MKKRLNEDLIITIASAIFSGFFMLDFIQGYITVMHMSQVELGSLEELERRIAINSLGIDTLWFCLWFTIFLIASHFWSRVLDRDHKKKDEE